MNRFDRAFADAVVERVGRLKPDTKPLWGKMNTAQMQGHLALVVRYSMGEVPPLPYRGTFVTRHVFRHLIVHQVVPIIKNVKLPRAPGMPKDATTPEADLEALRISMDAYLARIETGDLPTQLHPFFGPLKPHAWRKFHAAHFRHHLTQFGIGDGI